MENQTKTDWVHEAILEGHANAQADVSERRKLVEEIVQDITDGIEVLRTRDGCPVTHDMARERARNIAAGFVLKYKLGYAEVL